MKKDSSNIEMEDLFSRLSEIKSAEPTENLFPKILDKIQEQKKVSKSMILAVASVLLILLGSEYIWIHNNIKQSAYIAMIPKSNNTFYNE